MLARTLATFAVTLLLLLVGCNSGHEGLIPVSGTVTFDGAAPPKSGMVQFLPLETPPGGIQRTAFGQFNADGQYSATSFSPGDGLYPGKYEVRVVCNKPQSGSSKADSLQRDSHVAEGYEGTELVVEAGADEITLDLDVPLNKS
ncbi:MAG TPA: hypothetical protein VF175_03840 [Lacipirellula sp.]